MKTGEKQFEIEDTGPIEFTTFGLPEGGGVLVLSGGHGCGKSTALRCVSAFVDGEGSGPHGLTPRRNAGLDPKGYVRYGDVTMTIRRSETHSGTAEFVHIESKLDLDALVSPGFKKVEHNDEARIKALISLTGVEPDLAAFAKLVGGQDEFERLASAKTLAATDLITMAGSFRRDLHKTAKALEDDGNKSEGKATALRASIVDVDLDGECDEESLADAHIEAVGELNRLADRLISEAAARAKHSEATRKLADLAEAYHGPSVEESSDHHQRGSEILADLRSQLVELQREITAAQAEEFIRESGKENAIAHFKLIGSCEKIIAGNAPGETTSESDVAAARERSIAAKYATIQGAKIIDARKAIEKSIAFLKEAEGFHKRARTLRHAAKATDNILAEAITHDALVIEDGRLVVVEHPRTGGNVYYDELSNGDRFIIAIDLAVDTLARHDVSEGDRLLVISQTGWDSLNQEARANIRNHAIKRGVVIVTAAIGEGPLRSTVLGA